MTPTCFVLPLPFALRAACAHPRGRREPFSHCALRACTSPGHARMPCAASALVHSLDARSRASSLCAAALRVRSVTRESRRATWSSTMGRMAAQHDEIGDDARHRALRVRRMRPTAPLTSTAEPAHCDALVAHLTHRLPPTAAQILRRWSDAHDKVRDLRGYAAPRALCALGGSGGGGRGEVRVLGHERSGWISWVACSRGELSKGQIGGEIASSSLPALHLRSQPAPVRTHCRRAAAVRALSGEI